MRKTNLEIVNEIMTNSKFGPMAQLFVIDALMKMSLKVSQAKPEQICREVNPFDWIGVATEIRSKLEEEYVKPANPRNVL